MMPQRAAAALALAAWILSAGCGPAPDSLSVSGAVYDVSTASAPPVLGAVVTLRQAQDGSALASATTGGDGSFIFKGVPAAADVYLHVAKTGYATFDSAVLNATSSISGVQLYIALAPNVQHTMDLIAWNDPANGDYASRAWFALDVYDASGQQVPGVTVAVAPADATLLYNNGSDVFLPDGPTATLSSHSGASLVGGYGSVEGVHALTLADGTKTRTVKLPLVKGEMTYASVYPW